MRLRSMLALCIACTMLLVPPAIPNHVQSDSGRIVVFDHKTGNEWWVEVILSGQDGGQVSGVQARDDLGPWVALQFKSWGAWGASFHIEPGHRVQFRASWTGGAMQDSCWFTHPQGDEQCSTAPSDPFEADFSSVSGNEWWQQVRVTPRGDSLAKVETHLNGGAWIPLKQQSWNPAFWAGSNHAPQGTIVQFQATGSRGGSAVSNCYRWIPPQGQLAPETSCTPPVFDAVFTDVKGNDWWVEAKVKANQPLAGVDARVNCQDPWRALTLRSWGAWASSFQIPSGSKVDLRARSTFGAMDISEGYIWPQAAQTSGCAPPWPVAGSFADVRFRSEEQWDDIDGHHILKIDGLVQTVFGADGTWDGHCETRTKYRDGFGVWRNVTEMTQWDRAPPMGELPAPVGSSADAQTVENCALVTYPDNPVVEHQRRTFSIRTISGDPVPISAVHARSTGPTHADDFWWDRHHGLMLSWTLDTMGGSNTRHADGWLLNTDATFA